MGVSLASVWPLLRGRLLPPLLLALMAGVCVWSLRAVWPFTIDDAGISYAYAKHIAEGDGPVAVVGGPWVEGYSNPLWVFLLVPLHGLGFALPAAAKLLGAALFLGSLLIAQRYFALLERRGGLHISALALLFMLLLTGCLELVVWVPAGLENALFQLLLLALGYLDARESLEPGRAGLSGWAAFALSITRPEGALYAAPLLLIKLTQVLVARAYLRQALTFAAYWLLPWLLYQALHFAVFRQLVPNTYFAKPGTSDWASGYEYLLSNLETSGIAYVLPFAAIGVFGQLRQKLFWIWASIAGATFVIYSGGDWMPHARFLALFLPALMLLAALGVGNLARLLARLARGRLPAVAVVWAMAIGLSGLWWYWQLPRLRKFAVRPWCHFCERVSDTQRLIDLGRAAGLPAASLLTQDFGGPAWLSDERFRPVDFLGLCDQSLALIRRDRRRSGGSLGHDYRLYQAAIHEHGAPPSWVLLPRNFWPGFGHSPEYRTSYVRLQPSVLSPRARQDVFFGLHRAELVDYFPPLERFEFRPLGERLSLLGSAVFSDQNAGQEAGAVPGAALQVLVSVLPRARLRGTERLRLRVEADGRSSESEVQSVDREVPGVAAQLGKGGPLRFDFELRLPPATSGYRLSLGFDADTDVRRVSPAPPGNWRWVPLGDLPSGAPLTRYARQLRRYPTALPVPLGSELLELAPRLVTELERQRSGPEAAAPDAGLVRRLRELGESLEVMRPEQAYLAYIWATQLDARLWRDLGRAVFRLRPPGGDERFALELALLDRFYHSGTDADLARLVGFYLSYSQLLEAQYFLGRVSAPTLAAEPFATLAAELARSFSDPPANAASPRALAIVAHDPLGGALDFEAPELQGWEGVSPAFVAGAGEPHRSEPGLWGQHGRGLLSSLGQGRRGRGQLSSPEFTIDGSLLSLLVGGGGRDRQTGVDLLVEGNVVVSGTGLESKFLYPTFWDVSEHRGKRARLRVRDDNARAWVLLDRVLLWY